jgi:hypothetical protein
MRVSLTNLMIIAGALLGALLLVLVALRIARWRRDVALRQHGVPKLVMPMDGPTVAARPHISREVPVRTSPTTVRRVTLDEPVEALTEEEDVMLVTHDTPGTRPIQPTHAVGDEETGNTGQMVEGAHVRYFRPEEGTLEFLPGRLEIVSGGDVGQEIHFLRQVGEENATITFGRSEGPPLRHVQLLDPTVSRQHARLSFLGGRWHLANLSQTNPVSLNGTPIPQTGRALTLQDGDRLEMGAVTFLFHDR